MKTLIKKLIHYDKIYHNIKSSFFYHARKKVNGQIANAMYGSPSKDFFIIGVTGTNGKTTTVNLIHKILNDNLGKTVMVSTANIKIGNKNIKNKKKMTSLDIYDLQSTLAIARDAGCKIAVLEASSQGLDQYRFEGVNFDFAVLTNITHDHLDYHSTMEKYVKAKKMLFNYVANNGKNNKYWVFPVDDNYGKVRFEELAFDKKISYSINASSFLKADEISENKEETHFTFNNLGKQYTVHSKLPGRFNVSNILAALWVAAEIWIDIDKAIKSIEAFEGVDGRMQKISHWNINAYVDFAHTPDALEKALSYLRNIKWEGKLIVTFGAPWLRDTAKRPLMGQIVAQYADIVIVTDDDPDTENRRSIIQEITAGMTSKTLGKELFIVPERRLAIKLATELANNWDTLMFAWKWHESVQYTNLRKRPRSDVEEVKKALKIKVI